jgi:hypothetical protein
MAKGKNAEVIEEVVIDEPQGLEDGGLVEEVVTEEVAAADDVVDEITELTGDETDFDDTESDIQALDDEVLVECVKNTSIPKLALVKGETYLVKRDEVRKLLKHGMVKEVE